VDTLNRILLALVYITMGLLILLGEPISPILGYVFLIVGGVFVATSLLSLLLHLRGR
jgi:hypothetical protein